MKTCYILPVLASLFFVWWAAPIAADDQNARLLQSAAERIEQHRKANATITLVDSTGAPVSNARVSLKQTRHAFLFGCNIFRFGRGRTEQAERAYRRRFAELFNYATIGFYWSSYEREAGRPNHAYAGSVARWCQEQGITTKGHPLAWNYSDPSWLPDNSAEIRQLQLARITDCVSRFRGQIDIWDVVNEATHFDRAEFQRRAPKMTKMWEDTGQLEFVNQCFRAARNAGPNATLLINDYRTDPDYAELISHVAPIDGKPAYDIIGIQSHMHQGVWKNQKIWEVCERFSQINVPLHFTELTVLSGALGWEKGENWDSTPEGEKSQAEDVRRIYTMLFSHPSVTAITWWDFADLNAWQRAPAGLLDKQLQPKPAYDALMDLVKNHWWTRTEGTTDAAGRMEFRGFLGDYQVEVARADGQTVKAQLQLVEGNDNQLRIELPPQPLITDQLTDGTLPGWGFYAEDASAKCGDVWQCSDGVLVCRGVPKGYIYTTKDYRDFRLRLQWRWPPGKEPGNGGVLVRMTGSHKVWPKSLEAQINANQAGDFWGLDGYQLKGPDSRMKKLTHQEFGVLTNVAKLADVEKPAGQWNQYEILAEGEEVTLKINGQLVNQAQRCERAAGKICLTAEGDEVHFRNVELEVR